MSKQYEHFVVSLWIYAYLRSDPEEVEYSVFYFEVIFIYRLQC